MTAQPLSSALAKVRKLLPVRIHTGRPIIRNDHIVIKDRNGAVFCLVPHGRDDAEARAELIRDVMNEMA